jgi:Asp-tRNA(Asn)/Glu-tRNA(Gln) amidotransferase A subunit family amidase
VLGFKPTYARAPTTGVKVVAPSLDTVGWFARDVGVLDRVRIALTGSPATAPLGRAPRLAVVRTGHWHDADPDARAALDHAAHLAVAAGAAVGDAMLSPACERLAADQPVVMAYEAARSLAWEHRTHPELLSANLRALLERGLATEPLDYRRVLAQAAVERARADEIFGGADAVLTLAATGEAPAGLGSTGDPRFARLWTLLGFPTVSLPGLTGRSGLPVGVQLVGRHDDDATLLAIAAWLGAALPTPARPPAPAARGYS